MGIAVEPFLHVASIIREPERARHCHVVVVVGVMSADRPNNGLSTRNGINESLLERFPRRERVHDGDFQIRAQPHLLFPLRV